MQYKIYGHNSNIEETQTTQKYATCSSAPWGMGRLVYIRTASEEFEEDSREDIKTVWIGAYWIQWSNKNIYHKIAPALKDDILIQFNMIL